MNQTELERKLKKVEALHRRATTPGEKQAAYRALERLRARLLRMESTFEEMSFSFSEAASKKIFCALLDVYSVQRVRPRRRVRASVTIRASKEFIDSTLWPEFKRLERELAQHLDKATDRFIQELIFCPPR